MSLTDAHRADLIEKHAITPEVLEAAGIESGAMGTGHPWRDGVTEVWQERFDDEHRKPGSLRYRWPSDTPLIINRLREPTGDAPIIIAEGTLQHLAVASYAPDGYGVYGITGCWGWSGCDLSWAEGREIIVAFDADMSTNRKVWDAANRLKDTLDVEGAESVRFIKPPGNAKDGLDDVLARRAAGTRAPYLARLIERATDKLGRAPKVKRNLGPAFDDAGNLLAETAAKLVLDGQPAALDLGDAIALYRDGVFHVDRSRTPLIGIVQGLLGEQFRPAYRVTIEESIVGMLHNDGARLPERTADPILNTAKVMLDLRTGETYEHDPKYFSTVQIPIVWDPNAEAPRYLEWLDKVIPDQIEDLEETISMMLDPSRTPPRAAFLYGPSKSGKSTMARIAEAIVGLRNTSAVSLTQLTENKFMAANVYGKTLNYGAEVRAGHIEDLNIFKKMTGNDPIEAERKGVQGFTFHNQALFLFTANELPTVGESSNAYTERIQPFKFGNSFAGHEDPKIEEGVMEELPGILARLVRAWQRKNARGGYLPTSAAVRAEFDRKSDRVRQFAADCLVISPAETTRTLPDDLCSTKREITRAFDRWAGINKGADLGSRKVIERLTSIDGVVVVRKARSRAEAINVRIRPESEWDEDHDARTDVLKRVERVVLNPIPAMASAENAGSHDHRSKSVKDMGGIGLKPPVPPASPSPNGHAPALCSCGDPDCHVINRPGHYTQREN